MGFIEYDKNICQLKINLLGLKIKVSLSIEKFLFKIINKSVFKLLDKITPKSDKKIVFYLFPKFENNILTYYNYLKENHSDELEFYFVTPEKEICNKNTFFINSLKALYHMHTSKYVITTHASQFLDYFLSKRHIYINLWHGMPIKTLGFCEETLAKHLEKRYTFLGNNSYMFVTSDIFRQLFATCFHIDYKQVFVTGTPRTDAIWTTKNDDKIKSLYEIDKYDKVVFYLPTWKSCSGDRGQQVQKKFNNIFYLDDYDKEKFVKTLEDNNILFIIKPHPVEEQFYKDNPDIVPNSQNIKLIYNNDLLENNIDLYEFFKFTNLMISDYSSVALDYLILNRPVIYLNNLSEDYSKTRGMILEDNYEILMPGIKVITYSELEREIIENLKSDKYKTEREKFIPLIHKYLDGNSAKRVHEIMEKL